MDGCRRWWSWWEKKLSIQTTYLSVFSLMVPGENGEWNLFCSLTFFNAGEKMFLLCNYFIFLLIFFISCCWFSMEVCRSSFFFFFFDLKKELDFGVVAPLRCSLCFSPHLCCGFRWVLGVEWREGRKWTWFLELFLSFYSHWFTGSTEKKSAEVEGIKAVCSALFSIQSFLQIVSWGGRGRGFREELL